MMAAGMAVGADGQRGGVGVVRGGGGGGGVVVHCRVSFCFWLLLLWVVLRTIIF